MPTKVLAHMSYRETLSQHHSSRRALRQYHRDEQRQLRRKVQALVAGGLMLGFGATATLAAWNDQATTMGQFNTGEFAIEASTVGNVWSSTDQMQFETAEMYPGQRVYAPVSVRSSVDSSVDGEVTVSGAGSQDGLAPYLHFRTITVVPNASASEMDCSAAAFETASPADYVFGSNTEYVTMSGENTAPTTQRLQAQQAETIAYCFEVQLDSEAPNETQNLSTDYSWKFYAQSIAE